MLQSLKNQYKERQSHISKINFLWCQKASFLRQRIFQLIEEGFRQFFLGRMLFLSTPKKQFITNNSINRTEGETKLYSEM